MPRSPLVTDAVRQLATYFGATTDAAFIDRSWDINTLASTTASRTATASSDPAIKTAALSAIAGRSLEYRAGTSEADRIANLINGAVGVGNFLSNMWPIPGDYANQLKLYRMEYGSKIIVKELESKDDLRAEPSRDYDEKAASGASQHPNVNIYAANVLNPFMGPMTKDVGAVEIFMNSIPTLEFSRCVPYLNVDVISLNRTAGTVAPPLTLIGYINPGKLSAADKAMIAAQSTTVKSEVLTLGPGRLSGMELFTAPQTLANMGERGPEFVPVIDRFRPLASLGNLSLSTKIQGGTMMFTTGRLELIVHDRSRLREVAAFVRPDLYGTTFLDITHGWSHPEGGAASNNVYGKFLDALKTTSRFRIAGSSYNFEEGGQMKITLNIQTVGSTDLLYLGPRNVSDKMREMQLIVSNVNQILVARKERNTAPSMADYDTLASFQDSSSLLAAAGDKDFLQKTRKLIAKLEGSDPALAVELKKLVGSIGEKSTTLDNNSTLALAQTELATSYQKILDQIETYDTDVFGKLMSDAIFSSLNDNTFAFTQDNTTVSGATGAGSNVNTKSSLGKGDFISYGSVFMNFVAKPLKESGQYDEVQVIFYPFNKYAGAVHDLPISAFPMEKERFKKSLEELAKRSPNVSCRQVINMMYDRFTYFTPARAYLMAGFYDQGKANSGEVAAIEPKKATLAYTSGGKNVTKEVVPNVQLTFEQRLSAVGIPERRFTMPTVNVTIEGCPLTDESGGVLLDARGNPKTLIKIHVYDAAMDPHSTLSDIIRAAKDNELGIVTVPVAATNALTRSSVNIRDASRSASPQTPSEVAAANSLQAAAKAIEAGLATGVLERVDIGSLRTTSQQAESVIEEMRDKNVLYRVKGSYDEIKRLVTAGVPTIVYGSSTSAMTAATLASNTAPGLGNVQLLRAFTEPGEVRAESIDTGVPMLVVPSQLSISTVGCPLFSPMQRLYIDFGTGTSIDNVYNVISIDSTIGKDGFKTDVKLGFADTFAQYRSLNQNLALLALNLQGDTPESIGGANSSESIAAPASERTASERVEDESRAARTELVEVLTPLAAEKVAAEAALAEQRARIEEKSKRKSDAVAAATAAKAEAAIPESTRVAAAKVQRELAVASREATATAEGAARAAELGQRYASVLAQLDNLPPEVALQILNEAQAAVAEADNARANSATT